MEILSHSGDELRNFIVGICKVVDDKILECELNPMQNDWRMKNVSHWRFIVVPEPPMQPFSVQCRDI